MPLPTAQQRTRRLRGHVLALLTRPPLALWLLGAVLAAASLLALRHVPAAPVQPDALQLPLLVVALLFALGEVFVLHMHVRRERRSVSLSEVPLVLGLFFAAPQTLVLGRLLGALVALALHRRHRGTKLALGLLLFLAETSAALLVFRALAPSEDLGGPGGWLAAYVACAAASATSHVTVHLFNAVHDRSLSARELLRSCSAGLSAACAVATFGLLAEASLRANVGTAVLLVAVTVMLLLACRTYTRLSERHLALERLHRFGQVLASSPEVDAVLRTLLAQARELLRGTSAEVTFLPDGDGGRGLLVRLAADDTLERTVVDDLRGADPVSAEVVAGGRPVLLERGSVREAAVQYLELRGQREAVLVPLRGEVGVVGTLAVADRDDEDGFGREDVDLLQTVAESAAGALVKGRQMDQLRQDALHDALTGLPNRAQLERTLQQAQATADTRPFAVMLLDLNGFKAVNDTLGHERGDVLLQDVARRLTRAAPEGALVSRLGGDEFAVVLRDVGVPAEAEQVASRLVDAVRHTVEQDGVVLAVGTALGLAVAPEHGTEPSLLLRRADAAMYAAKRARAGATLWSPQLDEALSVLPSPRSTRSAVDA